MARRHAEGLAVRASGTTAQTWAAARGAKATLDHLCRALFTGLATEAGLPAPRVNGTFASYAEVEHADALAARAREVVGDGVLRMDLGPDLRVETRHCVSVEL